LYAKRKRIAAKRAWQGRDKKIKPPALGMGSLKSKKVSSTSFFQRLSKYLDKENAIL